MNSHGRVHLIPLPCCRVCGMDSGLRMTDGTLYSIVCEGCGYRTRKHPTRGAATREWMESPAGCTPRKLPTF